MNVDSLIDIRNNYRTEKNFAMCDQIRDQLDKELVFIFDAPNNQQEVYYLTKKYFVKKPEQVTHRKYVEQRIQASIRAEKQFKAWLYTINTTRL